MTEYMRGAWVNTDAPMYLVRHFGLGENVVRNGDLLAGILDGSVVPAAGVLWLDQAKIDRLTKAERKVLKAAGVSEIRPIISDTIRT